MKQILLTAFALSILLPACRERTIPGYTVEGEISGIAGTVYLTVFEGKTPIRIDSTEAANGMFAFAGDRALPIFAAVETPETPLVRFFLENRPIRISGTADDPAEITVTGSPASDLYARYRQLADSLDRTIDEAEALSLTRHELDSTETVVRTIKTEFVRRNPGSVAAAYVLYRHLSYDMTAEALDRALDGFDPDIRSSVYLQIVRSMSEALKNTAVGRPYSDVSAPDTSGRIVALSETAGKGKYVLLDFWASWCPPCRAELPNLVAAYRQYGPKGFEIYAVSLDKDRKAWTDAIRKGNLDWIHVSDLKFWENRGLETYGVRSIPSNILIGPDGTILARNLEGEALHAKLAELLGPTGISSSGDSTPVPSDISDR